MHRNRTTTDVTSRLIWPLILGLGLAAGLVCGLSANSAAKNRAATPALTVDVAYDAIWGRIEPGDRVTVTRTGAVSSVYGAAEADGVGFFWTPLWGPTGQPQPIADGDVIEVFVDGAQVAAIPVSEVAGGFDVLTDQVVGTIIGDSGGTPVTLTVGVDGEQPSANAPQESTVTNAAGAFTVTFSSIDLGAGSLVAVEYPSAGHAVRSYLYPVPRTFAVHNANTVLGYATPGQGVAITVYEGSGPTVRWSANGAATLPHGFYQIGKDSADDSTQAGDLVEVYLGSGVVLTTTVADMSITDVDTALDRITGTAPAGEEVTIRLWQLGGYHEASAVPDGSGVFVATFSAADLRTRDPFRAAVADAEGDESLLWSGAPFIEALVNPTSPWDCVMWRVDGPNLPVTLTIQTATGVYTRENPIPPSDVANGSAVCFLIWGPGWGPIDFMPGDTITLQSPTWQGSLVLADVTWTADTANEQINGQSPAGELEVTARQWYGDRYPWNGSTTKAVTAASPFTADMAGFDVRGGGVVEIRHYDPVTGFSTWLNAYRELSTPYFEVRLPNEVRGVRPSAHEAITATLYSVDGTPLAAGSDDGTEDPWHFTLYVDPESIQVGQWVTVTSESGWSAGMQVPLLTVNVDEGSDVIWGEAAKGLVLVEHYSGRFGEQLDARFVPVDGYVLDRGYFGGDVQRGDRVNVAYETSAGNRIASEGTWPWMFVTYDEDRVGGAYAVGHSLAITVTDSGGTEKATAAVTTSPGGAGPDGAWWHGFATTSEDWSPAQPAIQPADWVHFQSDDGYTNSIQVGNISGEVDPSGNTISGAIQVPGLAGVTLQGVAGTWGFTFRNFSVTLDAQGTGTYTVDFGSDPLPQDYDIIVQYLEPDDDRVGRYFRPSAEWLIYLPLVVSRH